jgi:cyclopropane fatty-acyl-phospholipid synthase-like methyltransferase
VDVGAGLGGPARYLASTFGCKVNAIEYLEKSVKIGHVINLLAQCGEKVQFINADITQLSFDTHPHLEEAHDLLVSQLALLHIEDKESLFTVISNLIKPGGTFFIEDFFKAGEFTPAEVAILQNDINVPQGKLNTKEEYIELLEKNGLEVETWRDDTTDWSDFVWTRYENFLVNVEAARAKNGDDYIRDIGHFYKQMAILYCGDSVLRSKFPLASNAIPEHTLSAGPHLGGVTIIGKKK